MLPRPPPIRVQRPTRPLNSFACARHASIGGAPRALMAHANASRRLTLSRSRRLGVSSAYVVRQANRAIPSAWLGPEMIGLGFSGGWRSGWSGFPMSYRLRSRIPSIRLRRLRGLSAWLGLVAENGVGHHGRIEVGADFHDHVTVEAAYPAVAVVEGCAFVGLRCGQQLSDRRAAVHVEVLHLQRRATDQYPLKAGEGGGQEFGLGMVAAGEGLSAFDSPIDVFGHAIPELRLGFRPRQISEQGDPVFANITHGKPPDIVPNRHTGPSDDGTQGALPDPGFRTRSPEKAIHLCKPPSLSAALARRPAVSVADGIRWRSDPTTNPRSPRYVPGKRRADRQADQPRPPAPPASTRFC